MHDRYLAEPDAGGPRGYFAALTVSGPAIRDLVLQVAMEIADAQHGTGEAAAEWDAYTTARLNYDRAQTFGPDDEITLGDLEVSEAIALDDLLERLSMTVRLPLADARLLADLLFERAGRVGVTK